MTKVNRAVRRETAASIRSSGKVRPIIVSIEPPAYSIQFRLKGERRSYELPIEYLFARAVQVHVAEEKAKKKAARKAARESR